MANSAGDSEKDPNGVEKVLEMWVKHSETGVQRVWKWGWKGFLKWGRRCCKWQQKAYAKWGYRGIRMGTRSVSEIGKIFVLKQRSNFAISDTLWATSGCHCQSGELGKFWYKLRGKCLWTLPMSIVVQVAGQELIHCSIEPELPLRQQPSSILNLGTPEFIYEIMKHMNSYMKKSYEFIVQ